MLATRRATRSQTGRRGGKLSRAHAIAARLEAEIIAGERKPRERLVELELAARFRVSRAPVREALRLLEREGLVASDTRGVHVAAITPGEVADIFEILAYLEELYTARAAQHLTADARGRMRDVLDQMATAVREGAVRSYFELNIRFHAVIREACPNRRLIALLDSLGKATLRYRHMAMSLPGRLPVSLEEHRRILRALEGGDAPAAGRSARESAERAFAELNHFLTNNPQIA
ncbi:MAG: FCD domain-containing protein [Candidatus Rokubacteria bacterium]|nr:FCD domain-containing protein [Candidatus Rokubacteria bacterium]MBI3105875.1 FCD domain-containing protein [Candidatus Rokubacteria bacterium]